MASFGSGFNDYVNGLRPPRSSLDGLKLTSVRGPRSSPVADINSAPSAGMPPGPFVTLHQRRGRDCMYLWGYLCFLPMGNRAQRC